MKKHKPTLQASKITIFLDRDGVVNKKAPEGDYINSSKELRLIRGAAKAIKYFNDRGFLVIIITNQRGIGKGIMTEEDFKKIMDDLQKRLKRKGAHIDAYYYCPDVDDSSLYRKPNIGMFLQAKKDFPEIDFNNSFVIGDSWRDVEAGKRIGAKTVLVREEQSMEIKSDYIVGCLFDIIQEFKKHKNSEISFNMEVL